MSCCRRKNVAKAITLGGSDQQSGIVACSPAPALVSGRWNAVSNGAGMLMYVTGCNLFGIWITAPYSTFSGTVTGSNVTATFPGAGTFTGTITNYGKRINWNNGNVFNFASGLTATYAPTPALMSGRWVTGGNPAVLRVIGNAVYGLLDASPVDSFSGITVGTKVIATFPQGNTWIGDVSPDNLHVSWTKVGSPGTSYWSYVAGLAAASNPGSVLVAGRWSTGGAQGLVQVLGNEVAGLFDAAPYNSFGGAALANKVFLSFVGDATQDNTWIGDIATGGKQIQWKKWGSTETSTWTYIQSLSLATSPTPAVLAGRYNTGLQPAQLSQIGNAVSGITTDTPPWSFVGVATGTKVLLIFSLQTTGWAQGTGGTWVDDVSADRKLLSGVKWGTTITNVWTYISA